ncbi:MAG: hypothetical protein ACYTBJ_19380 [Planctomycetota bacterium]
MQIEPYILFGVSSRSSTEQGPTFDTTRRTRWTVTLRVSSLESGGSVAVKLEAAPTADDTDGYVTLYDFGTVSAEGTTTVYSFEVEGAAADFSVDESDLFIRGNITANTGEYVLEMTASSRFWDPDVDAHREDLTKMLETSSNDLLRFMGRAERDVLRFLMLGLDGSSGALNINHSKHDAKDVIRLAIVAQGDWLAQREVLASSEDPEVRKECVRMRGLSPAAEEMLDDVVNLSSRVWRGR